jgi:hypothetical protein
MPWDSLNVYTRYKAAAPGGSWTPADMNAIQDEYGQKFTPQAWQTIALSGGGVFTPANLSYYKDSLGRVHIRSENIAFTSSITSGTTICTLPAGYRPGVKGTFAVSNGAGFRLITIDTTGVVQVTSQFTAPGDSPFVLLSANFRAEN